MTPSDHLCDEEIERCAARGWRQMYSSPRWEALSAMSRVSRMQDAKRIINGHDAGSIMAPSFVVGVLAEAVAVLASHHAAPVYDIDNLPAGQLARILDICRRWGVTADALRGKCRARPLPQARWDCWRYLWGAGFAWAQIGRLWATDHHTVRDGANRRVHETRLTAEELEAFMARPQLQRVARERVAA